MAGTMARSLSRGEVLRLQALTQRLTAALKEFRVMHAPNFRANNRLIFPPTLRLLPLWTLGAVPGPDF